MYTQIELIKLGLYAERAHRLSFDIALSAAELSKYGKGMAIVADETRNIGNKLFELLNNDNIHNMRILDAVLQLKFLAVNGYLEMLKLPESQLTLKKRIAVIMDEVKNLTTDIEKVFGLKQELPLVIPKISNINTVSYQQMMFALFTIDGIPFCETTNNILEIFYTKKVIIENNFIHIRGEKIPFYNIFNKNISDSLAVLVVRTDYEDKPKEYAVLIDNIPEIFNTWIGCSTKPEGTYAGLIRECWSAEEGMKMSFLDYSKLI